jgi:hypothetical protein
MSNLSALPDRARHADLRIQRGEQGNPSSLTDQESAFAEEEAFQELSGIETHPAGTLFFDKQVIGIRDHD